MHVGQAEVAALILVGQLRMVDAQAVQNRGVQVVNVNRVLDDVVAKSSVFAVASRRLDPAAGHPHREAARDDGRARSSSR